MRPKSFEFISRKFKPQSKRATFNYRINFFDAKSIIFSDTLILPKIPNLKPVPKSLLENILDDLHIVLGLSYYKLYCPKKIILNKPMSKGRAEFWNTLYKKGLGEFFYRNKIDFRGLVNFPVGNTQAFSAVALKRKDRSLVGVGGGKDSIVSLELLKKEKFNIDAFVVELEKKYEDVESVLKIVKLKSVKIKRLLDKKIINQDFPSSFNGHIPISSIYAFLGIFSAILYDYKYVIVSNEYSSNFGNIKYLGEEINHQWSKSQEFESLLRDYMQKYITGNIIYFSLLRPFYEIRIAKIFSKYEKYFSAFSSCNARYKINKKLSSKKWCGVCPKCVFVFIMLSAFLPKGKLLKIFGKNLYDDENLESLFLDILGLGKMKPFECVGTFEESRVAFCLAKSKFKDSLLVKKLSLKIKLDKKLEKKVLSTNASLNIPPNFIFIGMDKILISGFGKEGKESYKYLSKLYPQKSISVSKDVDSVGYNGVESSSDISVKSPGISFRKIGIQYTSATNMFLSKVMKTNTVIGVTGSKGKSTTASLLFSILKRAGMKVRLLGNIGEPMLSDINKIKKEDILILELSSYQLEDIYYSPNIAIITNLFPDHMNYHGGIEPYYESKRNIIKYQSADDFLFYNGKNKLLVKWASMSQSMPMDFSKYNKIDINTKLFGQHNILNIKAAAMVAKHLNVSKSLVQKAIEEFMPLPHRLQNIGIFDGITFYDDAISTTPDSTIMAIKSIPKIQTIFLGGEDRGYDFTELERELSVSSIKNIVLFPSSGNRILNKKNKYNILRTKNMKKAVEFAFKNTEKGFSCILSCASPSYSLWKNFEEKGNEYIKYIKLISKYEKEIK